MAVVQNRHDDPGLVRLLSVGAPSPSARAFFARSFSGCAVGYVAAAAIIAVLSATAPFAKGWWLVAYLALVGGLAQVLVGTGLIGIGTAVDAEDPGHAATWTQLALWNLGTATVAVADLTGSAVGVLTGSVLLLLALGMFAAAGRRAALTASRSATAWWRWYALLIVFLGSSVVVGAALAGAFPVQ